MFELIYLVTAIAVGFVLGGILGAAIGALLWWAL
jgi:hypothetical protein